MTSPEQQHHEVTRAEAAPAASIGRAAAPRFPFVQARAAPRAYAARMKAITANLIVPAIEDCLAFYVDRLGFARTVGEPVLRRHRRRHRQERRERADRGARAGDVHHYGVPPPAPGTPNEYSVPS